MASDDIVFVNCGLFVGVGGAPMLGSRPALARPITPGMLVFGFDAKVEPASMSRTEGLRLSQHIGVRADFCIKAMSQSMLLDPVVL